MRVCYKLAFFDTGSEVDFLGRSSSKTRDRLLGLLLKFWISFSLCLSIVLVAVIIKIYCDLRPTNSFCCFLFQPFFTARIVPHLTEPLAHFSHSYTTSPRSRPHSFSLLQNYDFLVHAHLVLDFLIFCCVCFSLQRSSRRSSRFALLLAFFSVKFPLLNSNFKSLQIIIKITRISCVGFVLSLLLVFLLHPIV